MLILTATEIAQPESPLGNDKINLVDAHAAWGAAFIDDGSGRGADKDLYRSRKIPRRGSLGLIAGNGAEAGSPESDGLAGSGRMEGIDGLVIAIEDDGSAAAGFDLDGAREIVDGDVVARDGVALAGLSGRGRRRDSECGELYQTDAERLRDIAEEIG